MCQVRKGGFTDAQRSIKTPIHKGFRKEVFTWGAKNITYQGESRTKYLNAIFEADNGNIKPLIEFART